MAAAASLLRGTNAWRTEHRRLASVVLLATVISVVGALLVVWSVGGALHTIVSPEALGFLGAINLTVLALAR